jgi:CHAT domain-containing protein
MLIPPELSKASVTGEDARWLILPDGPLHFLPFAALVMPRVGEDPSPRYLVEERPLLTALSATLYGTREGGAPRTLVAVGDPLSNAALPGARREAVAVAALFPGRARVLLGKAAREAAIKALEPGVSHLHFAAHAAIDARFPLDSYLALAPSAGSVVGVTGETGEGDNGRLYAWEIYEQLRLDADLVVLSACETARGDALGGDGVLGLAQAFRHAGAEAVIASLWRVSDRATVPVMERLYRALRDGASKEEALAIAQRGAIRSQDLGQSHPYHWAAFQLID